MKLKAFQFAVGFTLIKYVINFSENVYGFSKPCDSLKLKPFKRGKIGRAF